MAPTDKENHNDFKLKEEEDSMESHVQVDVSENDVDHIFDAEEAHRKKHKKVTAESLKTCDGWQTLFQATVFNVLPILTWLPQYK